MYFSFFFLQITASCSFSAQILNYISLSNKLFNVNSCRHVVQDAMGTDSEGELPSFTKKKNIEFIDLDQKSV